MTTPRPSRRSVLQAAGTVLTVGLAGCGSSADQPTTTDEVTAAADDPTTTSRATTTTDSSYRERFRTFLESTVESVESLAVDEATQTVSLKYVTTKSKYDAIGAQIGSIAGGFFRQVANGWQVTRLDATLLDPEGIPRATWHAKTKWFREYQNGEIESEDLSLRILETLEPVEDSSG